MKKRRPDIGAALEPGEALLWQGAPKRGRPVSLKGGLIAIGCYALTLLLIVAAWYFEVFHSGLTGLHVLTYGLVGSAAFAMFMALRFSLLDRRRARARDARTAYAITDRRALSLVGPYRAEMALAPGLAAKASGGTLTLTGPTGRLTFERLPDAKAARDTILSRIGEKE